MSIYRLGIWGLGRESTYPESQSVGVEELGFETQGRELSRQGSGRTMRVVECGWVWEFLHQAFHRHEDRPASCDAVGSFPSCCWPRSHNLTVLTQGRFQVRLDLGS